jgi:hypothetical protein
MFRVMTQSLSLMPRRLSLLAPLALTIMIVVLAPVPSARAGTYPMYQCDASASHTGVAPGWSAFGNSTNASTVLTNSCSSGGSLGDYVFSHGQAGAVEEDGSNGSQVGLAVGVPGSAPDVTIKAISAQVQVSSVTGDDAFLGFNSDGQALPGAVEIADGGSGYVSNESWTVPQGARDFEAYVNCTTDHSATNCDFASSTQVPALIDMAFTLVDETSPNISGLSGSLVEAGSHQSTVNGSQTIAFTGSDSDSGVTSASLKLTPQGSGSPYTKTFDFSSQCTYESWNACPTQQNVSSFSVPTATLKDDRYSAELLLTDAAGNTTTDSLGTIVTHNAPSISSSPLIGGTPTVSSTLSASPGSTNSNPEAGTLQTVGQWMRCDAAANNCIPIAGFTGNSYNLTAADIGHQIRYEELTSNNAGSASAQSAPLGPIAPSSAETEKAEKEKAEKEAAEREKAEREKGATGAGGASGANGSNGTAGPAGSSSSSGSGGVTINLPGSNLGSVSLGSAAKWVVSLKVSPHRVRRGTKIKLTGTVGTSPRPNNGKLIYLQARSLSAVWKGHGRARHRVNVFSKWVTFQAFRAKTNGTFTSTYRFRLGGNHTYQFQAVAPAEGQYLDPTGTSLTATVKEV